MSKYNLFFLYLYRFTISSTSHVVRDSKIFDLVIMKSLFLSTFFETKIKEENKLKILKKENLYNKIVKDLKRIQFIDKPRVMALLRKLETKYS